MAEYNFFPQSDASGKVTALTFARSRSGYDQYENKIGPLTIRAFVHQGILTRLETSRSAFYGGQEIVVDSACWKQTHRIMSAPESMTSAARLVASVGIDLETDPLVDRMLRPVVIRKDATGNQKSSTYQVTPGVPVTARRPVLETLRLFSKFGRTLMHLAEPIHAPEGWNWFQITPDMLTAMRLGHSKLTVDLSRVMNDGNDLYIAIDDKRMPTAAVAFPTRHASAALLQQGHRGLIITEFGNPGRKIWQTRALAVLLQHRLPMLDIDDCLQAAKLIEDQ